MDDPTLLFPIMFILFLLTLCIWGYLCEKKEWNKGFAPCGTRWKCFDVDSQGGLGYACECPEHHCIWISYHHIVKEVGDGRVI